jgi:hypothetical protein
MPTGSVVLVFVLAARLVAASDATEEWNAYLATPVPYTLFYNRTAVPDDLECVCAMCEMSSIALEAELARISAEADAHLESMERARENMKNTIRQIHEISRELDRLNYATRPVPYADLAFFVFCALAVIVTGAIDLYNRFRYKAW